MCFIHFAELSFRLLPAYTSVTGNVTMVNIRAKSSLLSAEAHFSFDETVHSDCPQARLFVADSRNCAMVADKVDNTRLDRSVGTAYPRHNVGTGTNEIIRLMPIAMMPEIQNALPCGSGWKRKINAKITPPRLPIAPTIPVIKPLEFGLQ